MNSETPTYVAIDLKSFYASVECIEQGLDPMNTNLVVADASKTEKTICLAVSPPLRSYGISGRARLYQVVQKVKEINAARLRKTPATGFTGSSYNRDELDKSAELELAYITAPPRMALYMEYSTRIYNVYLKYVAPEDIHVYSIDEVFIDITNYLDLYKLSPRELTKAMIQDVHQTTGVTATAGIGTNLYLAKIAMDIGAKHITADKDGVRIAQLDEMSYRRQLWTHRPLTDFWRVGKGYARKLEAHGMYTMGDVARCSIGKVNDFHNEDLLYKLFGVNAELLIDHAWGWESCTMDDIKAYKPQAKSLGSGQDLQSPYDYKKAEIIVREMADLLALDLVDKGYVTDQLVLTIGYDIINLTNLEIRKKYKGQVSTDAYGRAIQKHSQGTTSLDKFTSSTKLITEALIDLYNKIVNKVLLIRRINISANNIIYEKDIEEVDSFEQLNLFKDYGIGKEKKEEEKAALEREKKIQEAVLDIKKKYGKNAILKGTNLQEGATTKDRNRQIGGHKA